MTAEPGQFGRRRLRSADQTAKTPDLADLLAPGATDLPPARLDVGRYLRVAWFFARIHRHAVRTGLISRYAAESVS